MLSRNVSAFRHEIESHKSTVPEPKLSSAGRLLKETCASQNAITAQNVRAPGKRAGRGVVADERFHHLGTVGRDDRIGDKRIVSIEAANAGVVGDLPMHGGDLHASL